MFEVGDKVRVISDKYGPSQLGMTGTVDEVNRPGELDVQIEYDSDLLGLKKNQYRSEHLQLIASASPIRTETVTTRRIEPGVYGPLEVRKEGKEPMECGGKKEPVVYAYLTPTYLNAAGWRELARTATQLAEFLDAQ